MQELTLPPGWTPYAVAGDVAGTVWMTVLDPPGLARVGHHEAISARPMLLAAAADGTLWYSRADDRLGRRDASGTHDVIDLAPGSAPYGIAVAGDGAVWFTASGLDRVGRMAPGGEITTVDLPVADARAAMLTIDAEGTVWVALNGAGALARVRGATVEVVDLPDGSAPVGVSASATGVWYADIASGSVGHVDRSGSVERVVFLDDACRPHAVAADPDGGCWATLWGSGELARVTADGVVTREALPGREPHGLWVSGTDVWVAMESGSLVRSPRVSPAS